MSRAPLKSACHDPPTVTLVSFPCSESSDWEAKFYQIQSKYLLLLNELHNPQVSESDSRKEMVGQLLKDVVEAADRPQLNYNNAQFDRCVRESAQ